MDIFEVIDAIWTGLFESTEVGVACRREAADFYIFFFLVIEIGEAVSDPPGGAVGENSDEARYDLEFVWEIRELSLLLPPTWLMA